MKTVDWYFDFVSPFSYLQQEIFHRLPDGVEIRYQPVLFAGLLTAWGHKGPAEIPAKRRFTYRHVQWVAEQHGIPFKFPPAHPFNPIKALRLAIALDNDPAAIRKIFRFIWQEGGLIENEDEWKRLAAELGVADADARIADRRVKDALRRTGEKAVAAGLFGVPTFVADGELFWGFDATDMFIAYLGNPELFNQGELARVGDLPAASERTAGQKNGHRLD